MDISEYIDEGYAIAGSIEALSKVLGISSSNLTAAKNHRRPLKEEACVLLADYIKATPFEVICAAKIASAKSEDMKNIWRNALAAMFIVGIFSGLPSPAEAATSRLYDASINNSVHYVKLCMVAHCFLCRKRQHSAANICASDSPSSRYWRPAQAAIDRYQ